VSIAKAGIITTLNARASVLAAANPKYGRWRRNATPSDNVNLPPALLSRFDLLWLLLDEADRERDTDLSLHVTHVHVHGAAPGRPNDDGEHGDYFSKDLLRAYVGEVRQIQCVIDRGAERSITETYCELRRQSARQSNVVTARTLLSLIRLSQALARLRFSSRVTDLDVREAGRLVDASKASLNNRADRGSARHLSMTDAGIFTAIKEIARGRPQVDLVEIRPVLTIKGIQEEQLQQCVKTYSDVGVWQLEGTRLEFLE
jgi:DNA replication licensing factor MCM7